MDERPILATVAVTGQGPTGVTAVVNGIPQHFSSLDALFTAAVRLLDRTCPTTDSIPSPNLERSAT
jgi:hypothetical protein